MPRDSFLRESTRDEREAYREARAEEFAERDARREERLRQLLERGERLRPKDCANPLFDNSRVVTRLIRLDGRGRQRGYEWVTTTDNYVQVGCTYILSNGQLSIIAFEPRNAVLFQGRVRNADELSDALRAADAEHLRLTGHHGRRPTKGPDRRRIAVRCQSHVTDSGLRMVLKSLGIRFRALGPAVGEHTFTVTVTRPTTTKALDALNGHQDVILATADPQ